MRESCQTVRLEKHRVGDIACLTFHEAGIDPSGDHLPVFVVHGLLGRKERHIELCLALAGAGFLACTLDARHHGERATPEVDALLAGAVSAGFLRAFSEALAGTAADIATLATYFDAARYGVIGHSMGGYIAFKTAVVDPRAAVIVSIAGNPDWTLFPPGIVPPSEAIESARAESPLTHADRFWPRPLLMLHGNCDTTVSIEGVRRLFSALKPRYTGAPDRLALVEYPGAGHEMLPAMASRGVEWMREYLTP